MVAELEGDARRILRGRGILWQYSKTDDLFCPSSAFSRRLLKPIKTSVWSYGEIHSLERTEVLPWGARSGDGSDFISRAVIWAKKVSAKLAGALVAIKELLFCNQSHCHLFSFWGWARKPYSESQSCQAAGTEGISGDCQLHKSSPTTCASFPWTSPKLSTPRLNIEGSAPDISNVWCAYGAVSSISQTTPCLHKAGWFFACAVQRFFMCE